MVKTIKADTVADFLRWQKYLKVDQEKLAAVPRPEKLAGAPVPEDLNDLTLGQLAELWSIRTEEALIETAPRVVLGLPMRKVLHARTTELIGFLNFVTAELQRISNMWDQCSLPPTAEQMEAGISELSFGPFGIIDTWARRMGFTDHDEAAKTGWLVVWQCLRNDARVAAYDRRLQMVISRKSMRK